MCVTSKWTGSVLSARRWKRFRERCCTVAFSISLNFWPSFSPDKSTQITPKVSVVQHANLTLYTVCITLQCTQNNSKLRQTGRLINSYKHIHSIHFLGSNNDQLSSQNQIEGLCSPLREVKLTSCDKLDLFCSAMLYYCWTFLNHDRLKGDAWGHVGKELFHAIIQLIIFTGWAKTNDEHVHKETDTCHWERQSHLPLSEQLCVRLTCFYTSSHF